MHTFTEATPEAMDDDGPGKADPFAAAVAPLSPNTVGSPEYGSEVSPKGPRQDMYQGDVLAGTPNQDRDSSPADFTGGNSGMGAGGTSIGCEPGDTTMGAGTTVERGDRIGL